MTTEKDAPQGKYLEIDLDNHNLSRNFSDLRLPASNCAYIVYNKLTPQEKQSYDYLKVNLKDSTESHNYTFQRPELEVASAAGSDLNALLINLQTEDHEKILSSFNIETIPAAEQSKVPGMFSKIEKEIFPISDYHIHGNSVFKTSVNQKETELVRFYVTLVHPGRNRRMEFVINPQLHPDQPFLYGLNLLP
ncbi:hypothetical protein GCM10028822_02510 [Hymenobacter terrigena]